ncbi:MAG: TetR/AcrR family transcriptional regulator [Adlercreutzia equolifaciens]
MGRPRKDATTQDVRERLIVAMADRLIREPASAVTVTSLIKEVGCNRSTFYYYFADTEQLAEAALDAVVPVEFPGAALAHPTGAFSLSPATPNIPDLVPRNAQGIDTLCAVLNGPNAALAQKRVKRRLLEDVLPDLGVSLSSNTDDPTSRIVFEYATGGLLALMAYRAETGFAYPVETFLHCLAPEVPAALLDVLSEKR